MIKKYILDKIKKIKSDEEDFKSSWWKNNFISYSKLTRQPDGDKWVDYTKHISEVDFSKLNDDDLVRLFEYLILTRNDISTNRVNQIYFKK